ncbi:MAG: DUF2442 domain-containing protein [Caldilineales bacterium]|nr:DUF2442 domain-containing protein [Caldilineales bacterium]MCW5858819.1 DUF2442 domain-containing protein [Caldilineales bacterium]
MYTSVIAVHATDDHTLILTFKNNERRIFDISPYLNIGRFRELQDLRAFKQVSVSFDTVEWENELDIDPEFLYARSKAIDDGSAISVSPLD